ncbi:hypothetical protein BH11BAC5_BH11BAC5_29790 [soil metagenome]
MYTSAVTTLTVELPKLKLPCTKAQQSYTAATASPGFFGRLYSLLTRPNGFSRADPSEWPGRADLNLYVIFFCVQSKKSEEETTSIRGNLRNQRDMHFSR